MKATKDMHAIDFTALAQLTMDNKHAGIVALLIIEASRDGMILLTNKAIVEATGIDRKSARVAMNCLQHSRALIKDPVVRDIYHINSQLLQIHNPRSLEDAAFFPEFSSKIKGLNCLPRPTREDLRDIERMNKLSDTEIAEKIAA